MRPGPVVPPLVPPDGRLAGRWTRTLLERADGTRDTDTEVTWLQAHSLYVDLRLPAGPPPSAAACLRDLTAGQARELAAVEGFAGPLVADGPWACWRRLVDLQPAGPAPDEGRLDPSVDGLLETGRDGSYTEHWRRDGGGGGPTAAVLLRDAGSAAHAVLVRVGEHVGWARGRARPLPQGGHLGALVAAAGSLRAAQDLLDAEVSLGTCRRAGHGAAAGTSGGTATRSSLPWRVGTPLGLALTPDTARTLDTAPDGTALVRTWQVVSVEGDPADLPALEHL